MKIDLVWKAIAIWFGISLVVLVVEQDWGIVAFSTTYGVGFGGLVYRYRRRIRGYFSTLGKSRFLVFLLISLVVSITEELYVYSLGNSIAVPDIWLDIIIVPLEWTAWFSGWYFIISRYFRFNEKEVLLSAGITGILFEYSGKGFLFYDPSAMFIFYPTAIMIYAAIFVLPMQLIEFRGTRRTWIKYPASVLVPYLCSIPVGLVLYFAFIA